MRSGFVGFSSGLGLDSGFGLLVTFGGAIGRFADRGERTSIAGMQTPEDKVALAPVLRVRKYERAAQDMDEGANDRHSHQDGKSQKVNILVQIWDRLAFVVFLHNRT